MQNKLEGVKSEKIIVNEFSHLLEKSKQLFNGLRDLPQYGHKQWQTYFGRTFDVYTKLWKFQQQNRTVLDDFYGLKRWQIGEIASKIGQLYYHYYLRTSDTYYLNESFSFFSAIRSRDYFFCTEKDDKTELTLKKLRYYARYIIVCLLLKKLRLVRDLTKEFARHINNSSSVYGLEVHTEWNMVVQEVRDFIDADNICTVLSGDSTPVVITNRLTQFNCPPVEKNIPKQLQLAEILIVGNCFDQIRFSELTLDMFRILQCLERDPQDNFGNTQPNPLTNANLKNQKSVENGGSTTPSQTLPMSDFCDSSLDSPNRCTNPHKYLLYKPSYSQFNTFMAAGFKDLPSNGVLLLYISSDGIRSSKHSHDPFQVNGYDIGGVVTNSRREQEMAIKSKKNTSRETHCIYPGDLYPYTRKPLFLIVDSDNSSAFKNFQSLFEQPTLALLSPESVPNSIENQREKGNLYTLFLHCPLTAYLHVCALSSISLKTWERAQSLVDTFIAEACRLLQRSRNLDFAFLQFLGVDFLRVFILRHCFCNMVLQLHRDFRGAQFYPSCNPTLPDAELMESRLLQKLLFDLATLVNSRALFVTASDYSREC